MCTCAESGVEYDVVQAMDVNTTANKIYQHNFPDVSICASSIAVSHNQICLTEIVCDYGCCLEPRVPLTHWLQVQTDSVVNLNPIL